MCYNRFRYYYSETGRYISEDPIGFLSGEPNFFAYVSDTNWWLDLLGLDSTILGKNIGAVVGDGMENHHLIPEQIWEQNDNKLMLDQLGLNMDDSFNGRLVAGSEAKRKALNDKVYHRGSHPQYSAMVAEKMDKIRRKWKPGVNDDDTIRRIRKLQRKLNAKIRDGNVPRSNTSYNKIG